MYPWWLYALSPRDQSQAVMRIWNQADTATAAALTVSVQYQVPAEYVAILNSFSIEGRAGAGQQPQFGSFEINDPGMGVTDFRMRERLQALPAVSGNGYYTQALTGVLAGPGAVLTLAAVFSAGANANLAFFGLGAVLIPRGTLQVV